MIYVPQDSFFDIQILQNSISSKCPPQTPLGELTTLLHLDGEVYALPNTHLPRPLRRLAGDAFGIPSMPIPLSVGRLHCDGRCWAHELEIHVWTVVLLHLIMDILIDTCVIVNDCSLSYWKLERAPDNKTTVSSDDLCFNVGRRKCPRNVKSFGCANVTLRRFDLRCLFVTCCRALTVSTVRHCRSMRLGHFSDTVTTSRIHRHSRLTLWRFHVPRFSRLQIRAAFFVS